MNLHKELPQAFGHSQPLRLARDSSGRNGGMVVGGSLDGREAGGGAQSGFSWRKIDYAIVINPAGKIVDIDRPPWRPRGKSRATSMLMPQRQLRSQRHFSSFLWGGSGHVLGLRRSCGHGDVRLDSRAFNRFRTFHGSALAGTGDRSLCALLSFLQKWRPDAAFDAEELEPLVGSSLAFRFQYDEHFLHESHAGRLIWSRLLGSNDGHQEPA